MSAQAAHRSISSFAAQIQGGKAIGDQHQPPLKPASPDYIESNHIQEEFSYISSLPTELLTAIFEAGADSSVSPPFEILVSHISKRWRHVAINMPGLWTKVIVTFRPHGFDVASLYLKRSKLSALNLFVNLRKAYTAEDVTSVCQLIIPHIRRWNRIHIVCFQPSMLNLFLASLPSAAPLLRCMKIHCRLYNANYTAQRIFVDGAPSLTCLLLKGVMLKQHCPPLTAITSLRIYEPSFTDTLYQMQTELSALTHLVIHQPFRSFVTPTARMIELPLLRSLHARIGTLEFDYLVTKLSVPLLEFLLLEVPGDWNTEISAFDATSVPPRFPSLRSLTIRPSRCRCVHKPCPWLLPSPWRLYMLAFPTVQHFTLLFHDMRGLLGAMKCPPQSPTSSFWPGLHTLTLIHRTKRPNISLVRSTISARIASGHPIKKLQLSDSTIATLSDDLNWLREQVEVERSPLYSDLGVHWSRSIIQWSQEKW